MGQNQDETGQNKEALRTAAEALLVQMAIEGTEASVTLSRLQSELSEELTVHASEVNLANHLTLPDKDELLHELNVHQIELEMQNEELRQAQTLLEESRDRFVNLYDFAPVGYFTLTREAMIKELNLTGASLLGGDRKKLMNRRFSSMVALEDRDRWYRHFLHTLHHEGTHRCELTLTREDRTVFHGLLHCSRVSDILSTEVRIALVDVSERIKSEEELRIAAIAFESQDAIAVTDAKGVILRINQSFTHLTGYTQEEVVGKTPMILHSGHHDHSFFHNQQVALKETNFWQGEMWNRRKNGKIHAEWVTISAVIDNDNRTTHYVYTFSDITRHPENEAEIHRLAYYDPLTHLPNRRMLLDRIEQALATSSRNGTYGAILFLDLDHFKSINDTKGHDVGDQLLVDVAHRLHNALREGDTISRVENTVSRLGGDEFVVVLEDLSENSRDAALQTRQVAEKLKETLSQPYTLPSTQLFCTTSIGVTLFYKHDLRINTLLKQADLALFQAKKNGGNTLQFFDHDMQNAIEQRKVLEYSLGQALDQSQLQFYYQALTDSDQRIVGAEALLRWEDPERGVKTPCDFLRLAEDTGLIQPIGHWVLETACVQIKSWAQNPVSRDLQLFINISSVQFRHPDFVSDLKNILAQTGADPTRLTIDLREDLLLDQVEQTASIVQELTSLGVSLSLDGFGTGLSSLTSLRRLPVNRLKIDSSLIQKITTDQSDATIVSAIISMGTTIGLKIHAQGVETPEQMEFLKKHGCDTYQGFLISHPLPIEEFEQFLALNNTRRVHVGKSN
ncbi:MAG: EAL domain-containing protein [Leptospirales bacterium]